MSELARYRLRTTRTVFDGSETVQLDAGREYFGTPVVEEPQRSPAAVTLFVSGRSGRSVKVEGTAVERLGPADVAE